MRSMLLRLVPGLFAPLLFTMFIVIPVATMLVACDDDDDDTTSNTDSVAVDGSSNAGDDDDAQVGGACPPCPTGAKCEALTAPGLSASQLTSELNKVAKKNNFNFGISNDWMFKPLNGWVYVPGTKGYTYCVVILPFRAQSEIAKLDPPNPEVFPLLAIRYMERELSLTEFVAVDSNGTQFPTLSSAYNLKSTVGDPDRVCRLLLIDLGDSLDVDMCNDQVPALDESNKEMGWVGIAPSP